MNFREGMRRIGLVAGILGASVGLVFSHLHFDDVSSRRSSQRMFAAYMSGEVLQKELANVSAIALDNESWFDQYKPKPKLPSGYENFIPDKSVKVAEATAALSGSLNGWNVGHDGITRIYFDKRTKKIKTIETDHGTLYDFVSACWTEYLLIPVFPFVGFILPWGFFKIMIWIASGFMK